MTQITAEKIVLKHDSTCREYYQQINADKFENLGEINEIMWEIMEKM